MNNLADMHVHTTFSVDAKDDMEAMCQVAVDKGLSYVCFTEHLDYHPLDMGYGFYREDAYFRAVDSARQRFGDGLHILTGVEFGEPHLYPRELEHVAGRGYDMIVGSVHCVEDLFVGDTVLHQRYSVEEIFARYYEIVLAAVRFGGFDVLAHLDVPKRYLSTSYEPHDLIDEVLTVMIASDITLEVNTSPLRKGLRECSPGPSLLHRYVELGGRQITLGSDAHSSGEIAANFDLALKAVSRAKAGPVGFYRQRRFTPLDF